MVVFSQTEKCFNHGGCHFNQRKNQFIHLKVIMK
jgi:hypothetical protein